MEAWPAQALQFAYVALSLVLAAALLHLDASNRTNRSFAVLLVFRALAGGTYALGLLAADPATALLWWSVFPYFVIPLAFLPIHFLVAYAWPDGARGGARVAAAASLAAAGAGIVAYVLDHALFWDLSALAAGGAGPALAAPAGPLFLLYALFEASYALVALGLAREWARAPPGPRRASSLLVALGFTVVVLYDAVGLVVVAGDFVFRHPLPLRAALAGALLLALALALSAVAVVASPAARARDPAARSASNTFLATVPLPFASVALVAAFPTAALTYGVAALWRLALPLLVTYALVRHRVFGIDLRIKGTIRHGTLAAVFVAVFFVVSEATAALFQGWTGSVFLGIGAAGLLVFALAPLQRLAERVADAAMPRVERTPEYFAYRKLQVYRAAVEGAWADRLVSAKERGILDRLRLELDVSPADAAAIEEDVVAALPAAPPASPAPPAPSPPTR